MQTTIAVVVGKIGMPDAASPVLVSGEVDNDQDLYTYFLLIQLFQAIFDQPLHQEVTVLNQVNTSRKIVGQGC